MGGSIGCWITGTSLDEYDVGEQPSDNSDDFRQNIKKEACLKVVQRTVADPVSPSIRGLHRVSIFQCSCIASRVKVRRTQ